MKSRTKSNAISLLGRLVDAYDKYEPSKDPSISVSCGDLKCFNNMRRRDVKTERYCEDGDVASVGICSPNSDTISFTWLSVEVASILSPVSVVLLLELTRPMSTTSFHLGEGKN